MRLSDNILLNDSPIKKTLIIVSSIQLALLGSIYLGSIGIDISFIREIIGLYYLLLIPGFLLLRILGIRNIEKLNTILLAIGLSIFVIMICGLSLNVALPLFHVLKPISLNNLILLMIYSMFYIASI